MKKATDFKQLIANDEPKIQGEISTSDLIRSLNWYSQNKDTKDSYKYALAYFKKTHKIDPDESLKNAPSNFGFICRMITNGSELSGRHLIWFNNHIDHILKDFRTEKKPIIKIQPTERISIQDRITLKASDCIAEIESQIDELITSKFTANVTAVSIMHSQEIKGVHANRVVNHLKNRRAEFDEVLNSTDKQLKEGYSNFTKPQLKKIIAFFDQGIVDGIKISGEAVKSRKPRKRKTKTPDQIVSKIKFCAECTDLKVKSIDPKLIIGSLQLWVYNIKTRKLGVYHAEDAGGLSIKGTTIVSFNETKSVQKKLRKPEVTLPEIISGGKVHLRNALDSIRAVESGLTGRLNDDTVLVRVVK